MCNQTGSRFGFNAGSALNANEYAAYAAINSEISASVTNSQVISSLPVFQNSANSARYRGMVAGCTGAGCRGHVLFISNNRGLRFYFAPKLLFSSVTTFLGPEYKGLALVVSFLMVCFLSLMIGCPGCFDNMGGHRLVPHGQAEHGRALRRCSRRCARPV